MRKQRHSTSVIASTARQSHCFTTIVKQNHPHGEIAASQAPRKDSFFWKNSVDTGTMPKPISALNAHLLNLKRNNINNINYAWISEQGYVHKRLKHRQLSQLFMPPCASFTFSFT
ncbi:MAG: hypothetical protein V3V09_03255 [Arenicellales bacterium]